MEGGAGGGSYDVRVILLNVFRCPLGLLWRNDFSNFAFLRLCPFRVLIYMIHACFSGPILSYNSLDPLLCIEPAVNRGLRLKVSERVKSFPAFLGQTRGGFDFVALL